MSATTYVNLHQPAPAPAAPRDGRKFANERRTARNDYPAGSSALLSNGQKAAICMLACAGFARANGRDARNAAELREWRVAEQRSVTGKDSLTICTQADYLPLLAHFSELAGEHGRAVGAHIKDATSSRRVALHKLKGECAARGLTLAWPGAICRSKFKCGLDDASPQQLWKLVFDVRNSKHEKTEKLKG